MKRRVVKLALVLALLHYVVLLCISGIIFLLNHVPPKAVNLDTVILVLFNVEWILTAPRKFLLWAWPGESTPNGLSMATTILNSVLWGSGLAVVKIVWGKIRE